MRTIDAELLAAQKTLSSTKPVFSLVFLTPIPGYDATQYLLEYTYNEPGRLILTLENSAGAFNDLPAQISSGRLVQMKRGLTVDGVDYLEELPRMWVEEVIYNYGKSKSTLIVECIDWRERLRLWHADQEWNWEDTSVTEILEWILARVGLNRAPGEMTDLSIDFTIKIDESGQNAISRLMRKMPEYLYAGIAGQIKWKEVPGNEGSVYTFGWNTQHPVQSAQSDGGITAWKRNTIVIEVVANDTGGPFTGSATDSDQTNAVGDRTHTIQDESLSSNIECDQRAQAELDKYEAQASMMGIEVKPPVHGLETFDVVTLQSPAWGGDSQIGRVLGYSETYAPGNWSQIISTGLAIQKPGGRPVIGSGFKREVWDHLTVVVQEAIDTLIQDDISSGTLLPNATTDVKGIVELATTTEAVAGTDTERAVTPAGLVPFLLLDGSRPMTGDLNFIDKGINTADYVVYDTTPESPPSTEGSTHWNADQQTVNIDTGRGVVMWEGLETHIVVYNATGIQIDKGSAIRAIGAHEGRASVALAMADNHEDIIRPVHITAMDIPDGEFGLVVLYGYVKNLDTVAMGLSFGLEAYLSPTVPGGLTNTKPEFPFYPIRVGGVSIVSSGGGAEDGEFLAIAGGSVNETIVNFWNGTFRESFLFTVTEAGGVITGTLTPNNGQPDLTMMFSDEFTMLDTDPGATIVLTAGADDQHPQLNYVYIPKTTKVLTLSTSGWPAAEHIRVAKLFLKTATTTGADGALRNQNSNDHIQDIDGQGHASHIGQRIRAMNAEWDSESAGVEATLTGTTSNVYISTTAGKVFQMHLQTFPALSMPTDNIHVVNDSISPYRTTNNLNDIDVDALGNSLNNKYFSIVVWGVQNQTGETSHLMVNLPIGSYATSEATAVSDSLGYSVYNIPKEFRGVGFLIARFTMRKSTSTFTYNIDPGYQDLRGFIPNSTAGSGAGASGITTFPGLTDTPSTYAGQAGKAPVVNAGETAVEFEDVLFLDGTKAMTGDLDMGNQNIVNPGTGHDAFTDSLADEHIDHTTVSISSAGLGLTGGGAINTNQTITLASSSNPGVSAKILASDASGQLQLVRMGINVAPTASRQLYVSSSVSAIYGAAAIGGVGVTGESVSGIGVNAVSVNGVAALNVNLGGAGTNIARFQDNGIEVWAIRDGGALICGPTGTLDLNGVADALILDANANTTISSPTAAQIDFEVGGTDRVVMTSTYTNFSNGLVFLNETANTNMTIGLTINQGSNDGEAVNLRSTDVGAVLSSTQTGTYGVLKKAQGSSGGLLIQAFKDSEGSASLALFLDAYLEENATTNKTTAATAIVTINARQTDGSAIENTTANGNLMALRTQRGGVTEAVAIWDEDGDFYYNGALVAYDDENDALAAWDLSHVLAGEWNKIIEYSADRLEAMGVIGPADENNERMVSNKRLNALLLGAAGQLHNRCQRYETALQNAGLLER